MEGLYARESQAQIASKSFMGSAGNIWSQVVDEAITNGEAAVAGQFLEQLSFIAYTAKEKAADYVEGYLMMRLLLQMQQHSLCRTMTRTL